MFFLFQHKHFFSSPNSNSHPDAVDFFFDLPTTKKTRMSTAKLDALAAQARDKVFEPEQHADNAITIAMHRMLHDPILWAGVVAIYTENGVLFQRAFRQYIKDFLQL